jgi:uncharacterized protein
VINQQHLKFFGITCGLAGILLLHNALPIFSLPPVKIDRPSAQSLPDPQPTPLGQKLPLGAKMTVKGQTILMEVARTAQEQSIGLMYRTELAADRGMVFVFSPPRPVSFWMKNTLIPLDMLFVADGVVKHIGANIQPCKADPCPGYGPAADLNIDRVIELRAGRAAELRLKVGDRLNIVDYSAKRLN